jgi:cytochrome c oxidase subunit 2
MRPKAALALLPALVLAGCGSAKIVSPTPQTVVGSVPKQTAPATTSTTSTPATTTIGGGGGTTTAGTTIIGGGGGGGSAGKALFASNGCNSCHTFKAAGANGKIGPDLDKLPQYAKTAGKPLPDFVHESIVSPKAYIEKGYPPVMPSFASLPKSQIDALVAFLTKGS